MRLQTNMITKELRRKIENGLENYNKYRSPEVNARLLSIKGDDGKFTVSFSGPFCRTCSLYDYFEDLVHELREESNIRVKVFDVKQESETGCFKVTYKIEE